MEDILKTINDFVFFGQNKLGLGLLDSYQATNRLYEEFNVYPTSDEYNPKVKEVNYFVNYFTNYYKAKGLNEIDIGIHLSKIFDIISASPSEVYKLFSFYEKKNPQIATSFLYEFGINNYYIHKKDIDKNVEWEAKFKDGGPSIEISINLSKPEKSNKDIAKLLSSAPVANYPKCVLCIENLGFVGNEKKAPRHNIRVIPMLLNGEPWFMQFSPYGYFKEHMILVDFKHENMAISPRIFGILFAFLERFPHYSIVSNSDLPIVGGSILNHEHFQGGNYVFPLQKAKDSFIIKQSKFPKTTISVLDFYNTAFKFKGKSNKEIVDAVSYLLEKWREYSDESVDVVAYTNGVRHNTITPILRRNGDEYEFIAILRNNNTSEKYPDGIFHVHPEYFAIKKEGIGVIEAMGRFILPARLVRQINEVEDAVNKNMSEEEYLAKYPDLIDFKEMINEMKEKGISAKEYINDVGRNILINTSVFKKDEIGKCALNRFINSLNL